MLPLRETVKNKLSFMGVFMPGEQKLGIDKTGRFVRQCLAMDIKRLPATQARSPEAENFLFHCTLNS